MPSEPSAAHAQRVEDYLRAVLEPKRGGVLAGPFVFYVHPTDPHPYLNYAIPLPGATAGDGGRSSPPRAPAG